MKTPKIIDLPKIGDPRGHLTFVESDRHVPFEIRRVYYVYDVPGGAWRGSHALRKGSSLMIAASGSFDVVVHDGTEEQRFQLNRSYYGLYVPPMIWKTLENFSTGSVCLALASTLYDKDDYIRDKDQFMSLTASHKSS